MIDVPVYKSPVDILLWIRSDDLIAGRLPHTWSRMIIILPWIIREDKIASILHNMVLVLCWLLDQLIGTRWLKLSYLLLENFRFVSLWFRGLVHLLDLFHLSLSLVHCR